MAKQERKKPGSGFQSETVIELFAESMISAMRVLANPGGYLAEIVGKSWRNYPKATTVVLATLTFLGAILVYVLEPSSTENSQSKDGVAIYQDQVKAIDQAELSLRNSIDFLEQQKKDMQALESKLSEYTLEHERLRRIVAADSLVLNSILYEHVRRLESVAKSERWFGFGLGVVSSLVASAIFYFLVRLVGTRRGGRGNSDEPSTI